MKKRKSYTLQELCNEYEVDTKTMYRWLAPIRKELLAMTPYKQRMKVLIPKQVKRIREFLG